MPLRCTHAAGPSDGHCGIHPMRRGTPPRLASQLAGNGRYLGGQTVWFLSDFVAKILPALAKQLPDEKFKLVRP